MKRLVLEDRGNAGGKSARASAISGFLLVAPLMACTPQTAVTQEKAELSCQAGGLREDTMQVGGVSVKAKANCEGESVRSVNLSMPCGSKRFQESCTLTLAVPGEASVVRGRNKVPLDIRVVEGQGSASVEVKRKE